MASKLTTIDAVDLRAVPLPNGTKVTSRIERRDASGCIPEGAVGQVVRSDGEHVVVKLARGGTVRYLRTDVVPTKLGQARYAVRREDAWRALRGCVVLETVVGSRAWGLADESSDTDMRGVMVLPFSWTVSLAKPPSELISLDGSATFWEIDKALWQAIRADPNTLETLFVAGATATDPMGEWLLEARDAFVSQELYGSFGRYALSQLKRLRQSQRLARHRVLLGAWVRDDPTMTLDAASARLAKEAGTEAALDADAVQRAKTYIKQFYVSLYDQGLLEARDFSSFVRFAQQAELDGEPPRKLSPKNAYNLIRLIATATDWLSNGRPTFELEGQLREDLLAIKRGDVDLEQVMALAQSMMPALDRARETTRLPPRADLAAIDRLLRRVRTEAGRRFFDAAPGPFGRDAPEMPAELPC